MKKALLISYYFPPAQTVAGARVYSWAKNFNEFGIHPTVVTRHWKGDETKWTDLTKDHDGKISFERLEDYDIYKLPSAKIGLLKIADSNLSGIGFLRKFIYLFVNAIGYFNAEADAHASFSKFLVDHLKSHSYDLIIVSSPPLNLIRLAAELNKKFTIPVHVDFRDLWNNGYLNENYSPPFNTRWIDRFKKRYLTKWMQSVDSASTVSGPIAEFLEMIFKRKFWVLTNGFDEDLYINKVKSVSSKFRIALMGSYYGMQEMNVVLSGLKLFLEDKRKEEVSVLLIGLNVNHEMLNKVLTMLPEEFIIKKDRVSPKEAAQYAVNTEVIMHASWRGFKGIYTTKIFDYVASGSNILLAPGDNDVADKLILDTQTGMIAGDATGVARVLEKWFMEWKVNGKIEYQGNKEVIKKYGRKVITAEFVALINQKSN